jgi:hypothetical protein
MQEHEKKHLEKRVSCDFCGKGFVNEAGRAVHERLHMITVKPREETGGGVDNKVRASVKTRECVEGRAQKRVLDVGSVCTGTLGSGDKCASRPQKKTIPVS